MGAFNTVRASAVCPRCHSSVDVTIQFKYGDTWQHEYSLGDRLRWGGNDIGLPGKRSVIVDGVAETPCSNCGFDDEWGFYVLLECDQISRAVPADGTYDFSAAGRSYIVLQEG
jgi:hypothetical protein